MSEKSQELRTEALRLEAMTSGASRGAVPSFELAKSAYLRAADEIEKMEAERDEAIAKAALAHETIESVRPGIEDLQMQVEKAEARAEKAEENAAILADAYDRQTTKRVSISKSEQQAQLE